ncbi:MAG: DegT/DnrJ/EryC1/StrS family aminotransferase [Acidimicrobiales bacterium]
MSEEIALFRTVVAEEAIAAASAVLRSGWPGPGGVVERFEGAFAQAVGAPHAVACNSGTAALHLGLRLLDLEPGDEVIVSPITFVGANEVVLELGCAPVFADVDPATGLADPAAIAAAIGPRTTAIVVTHLGGRPADLAEIYRIAERHDLAVVEDAAHACGSTLDGAPIGSHPGTQAFSFQATKNLTTVDGGMVCVRTEAEADRARRLRWMGIDRSTWDRASGPGYSWSYEVVERGHKYAMNDLAAALGLADCPRVARAPLAPGSVSATYLATILAEDRDDLIDALSCEGIATGVHYRRNDDHPLFGGRRDLPGAERYWTRTLSLPCHLALSDDDAGRVADAVERWALSRAPARS